jgi:tetratricopeptide (TPR) repeat protein
MKPFNQRLLDAHRAMVEEEYKFLAVLNDQQRGAPSNFEHWSAKDLFGHHLAWKSRALELLEAARDEAAPAVTPDYNDYNATIYETQARKTWDEIQDENQSVNRSLEEILAVFPEKDMLDADRFSWRNGRPLLQALFGSDFYHGLTHMGEWYQQHDRAADVQRLQERMEQIVDNFQDNEHMYGVNVYNLACFCSLTGAHDRALELLPKAFRLNPSLVAFSHEDTDLDPIRNDPRYSAAVKDTEAES